MSVTLNQRIDNFQFNSTDPRYTQLSDCQGQNLILYFYPKDDTPGCTNEAKDFTAYIQAFTNANTMVIGISKDTLKSHEKFKAKYDIPYPLIADPEKTICELFDVMKLKKFMGREYMGIERSTFLIDSDGILRHEWRNVKVPGHIDEVLTQVKTLNNMLPRNQ